MDTDQIIDRLIEISNVRYEGSVSQRARQTEKRNSDIIDMIASLTYEDLRGFVDISATQAHRLTNSVPMSALKIISQTARIRMIDFRNLTHDQ